MEKPTWAITTESIGLRGQDLAQDLCRGGRILAREQRVRVAVAAVLVLLLDQPEVLALLDHAPLADHADRHVAAAVEGVDGIDERGSQVVVHAHRHRQQPAGTSRLEGMDHPQGQHVVAVAADVGVVDQAGSIGGGHRRRLHQHRRHQHGDGRPLIQRM